LSFRKAAEALDLTQPAVSLQIKALEEQIGVQLFDRTGAHIALTKAGAVLLDYSQRAHSLLAEAEQQIAALSGEQTGTLALGASTTIAQYVLPHLLGEFSRKHPRVQFRMISGNTELIVQAVETQTVALGLIEGPSRSRDLKTEPFLEDELVLIVPTAHEWAEAKTIAPAAIGTVPLLMRERGSGTRKVIEMALTKCGLKLNALRIAMEVDSTEAIKSAVEAGLGVGFVSRWAISKDRRLETGFHLVSVEGLRITRPFLIAAIANAQQPGPASEFRKFLVARAAMRKVAIADARR
jgi:DNA-binding transcriptional LysR family regulator